MNAMVRHRAPQRARPSARPCRHLAVAAPGRVGRAPGAGRAERRCLQAPDAAQRTQRPVGRRGGCARRRTGPCPRSRRPREASSRPPRRGPGRCPDAPAGTSPRRSPRSSARRRSDRGRADRRPAQPVQAAYSTASAAVDRDDRHRPNALTELRSTGAAEGGHAPARVRHDGCHVPSKSSPTTARAGSARSAARPARPWAVVGTGGSQPAILGILLAQDHRQRIVGIGATRGRTRSIAGNAADSASAALRTRTGSRPWSMALAAHQDTFVTFHPADSMSSATAAANPWRVVWLRT